MARSPLAQPSGQFPFVGGDRVPADAPSSSMAACMATAPTTFGEPASSRSGGVRPDHLVEVDEVDGAAAGQERVARRERRPRADQRARAEGAYSLWPLKATKSAAGGQRPVRGELGGVDEDGHPALVGGLDDRRRSAAASRSRWTRR